MLNATPKRRITQKLFAHWPELLLLVTVLALWVAQLLITLAFKEQLSVEDAGESIRSPYWWSVHHTVLNGIASNLGYYSMIAWAYQLFGFTVYMAKWVRLALHFLGLVSWALLLYRWMGARRAIVPLLIAGLSPAYLHFNTNQTSYGIDLQYIPFVLLLACLLPGRIAPKTLFISFILGFVLIWGALSFPTMLFYFPSVLALMAWRYLQANQMQNWRQLCKIGGAMALGAATPILAFLLCAKSAYLLIYDPYVKAGMMRGGGGGFTRRIHVIAEHYVAVWRDLFDSKGGYTYNIPATEFGNMPARFGFALVFVALLFFVCNKWRTRPTLKEIWQRPDLALLGGLILSLGFLYCFPQFVATFPGLRRTTGFLVAFYGLLAFLWYEAWNAKALQNKLVFRTLVLLACVALLIGRGLSNYRNLNVANDQLIKIYWFAQEPTLHESLVYWEKYTREGGSLKCDSFESINCRYQEIFPAIQGMRLWNYMEPHEVLGWDPFKKVVRPIEISIWESYEWPRW